MEVKTESAEWFLHTPRYGLAEAARYIPGLSRSTLRSWALGRTYPVRHGRETFEPVIELPDPQDQKLSFINLVEAHVLYGLRSTKELSIRDLRKAIQYAQDTYGITHLLAHEDLRATPGNLFLDRYGELVNLTKAGQLAMRTILQAYLKRLVYAPHGFSTRLYPIVPWAPEHQDYLIDPKVAYGKPIIKKHGVRVATIVDRYNGDEPVERLAQEYGLEQEEVRQAIAYARAA